MLNSSAKFKLICSESFFKIASFTVSRSFVKLSIKSAYFGKFIVDGSLRGTFLDLGCFDAPSDFGSRILIRAEGARGASESVPWAVAECIPSVLPVGFEWRSRCSSIFPFTYIPSVLPETMSLASLTPPIAIAALEPCIIPCPFLPYSDPALLLPFPIY